MVKQRNSTVWFVSIVFREDEAQGSNFSTGFLWKWQEGSHVRLNWWEHPHVTCKNTAPFFCYRSINGNSSFSYSSGSPACPPLFGTFHFIAAPHHGLFKGKTGLCTCSRKLWGQLETGSVFLHVAAALMRVMRVLNSPGPDLRSHHCWVESLFWRTEELRDEFLN